MTYNPDKHHRRSIRLRGYDYAQDGAYFVTICTRHRACLFGEIVNGEMILNDAGRMVNCIVHGLKEHHSNIEIDESVVMPNHLHVIFIQHNNVGAKPIFARDAVGSESISARDAAKPGLPGVVQTLKRHTTIEYIKMVKNNVVPAFDRRIWQRNYYERIIRDDRELNRIREYIIDNPANWEEDENHPVALSADAPGAMV